MMYKETAYKVFDKIASIEDIEERRVALRHALLNDNVLAIIVQRTYHPNYNFALPEGKPNNIKYSNHDEAGPLYQSIKKWDVFRIPEEAPMYANMKSHIRELQFINLLESVAADDVELLIGVKDKKLPWDSLSAEFVADAIPELFPPGFRPSAKKEYDIIKTTMVQPQQTDTIIDSHSVQTQIPTSRTAKEQCLWIMQNNPGLNRKDYIELFERIGIKKATAGLYYQELKKKI